MATRNAALQVTYTAWDNSANTAKTGDSSAHSLKLIRDGVSATPTNSPSEVSAADCPGLYLLECTAAEMNCGSITIAGKSSTADVSIIPTGPIQGERLPNAAPGEDGGVPTVDASNRIAGIQGTITDLDGLPTAADVWAVGTRTLSAFSFSVDVGTIESGDATTALETAATASLNAYDPPTKAELDSAFTEIKGSTWSSSTDTLEQIVDRGNAAWVTATGFSVFDASTDSVSVSSVTSSAANTIADGLLDRADGVEPASGGTERTVREALRLMLSASAGKVSGADSSTITFRDLNDSLNRIVATVDADGNRSALTYNDS